MNMKFKALMGAIGILLCSGVAGALAVAILQMIPWAWVPWLGILFLVGMAFYVIYNLLLNDMQTRAELKQMTDQK